jgi:molecular chaperone DnaK
MYKSATPGAAAGEGPQPGGNGAAQEPKKDEGVIDAEYVDVEDKK